MAPVNFEERLQQVIAEGEAISKTYKPNPPGIIGFETLNQGRFRAWVVQTRVLLQAIERDPQGAYTAGFGSVTRRGAYPSSVEGGVQLLHIVFQELQAGHLETNASPPDTLVILESLCERFHPVARQLRRRHDQRPTLDVADEYDVQDLMHALLQLHFHDIRAEEWTPSYAGAASRVDFLLKPERTVLEIKKTRRTLTEKKLGEELIVDSRRYQAHQDCDTLVCFVYDPDGLISNPRGVESDLAQETPLKVKVLIRPM